MKTIAIILSFCLGSLSLSNDSVEQITLRVKITNVANEDSNIMIAVFESHNTFLTDEMYRREVIAVDNFTETEIKFKIEKGEYAVAVFQDKNKNGDLDRNMFYFPSEPYGFSQNYRPVMKPPHWTDVAFQVNEPTTIEVRLD